MNHLTNLLVKIGILKNDLDYHFIRASMVIIFLFFGYQQWFEALVFGARRAAVSAAQRVPLAR